MFQPVPARMISTTTATIIHMARVSFFCSAIVSSFLDGFHRIRHYRLFANRHRAHKLGFERQGSQREVKAATVVMAGRMTDLDPKVASPSSATME